MAKTNRLEKLAWYPPMISDCYLQQHLAPYNTTTFFCDCCSEAEVRGANAEAKVSSLEIEVRRAKNEAHAAIDDIMAQLRQKQVCIQAWE